MIKCNLLKFSFLWNFRNKIVSRIYSNIFCRSKMILCNKNKKVVLFSTSNKSSYYWIKFFIAKHISNHVIKIISLRFSFGLYSSIFLQLSSISFEYSIKALESLKCFKPALFLLLIKNDIFLHMDL